jgi:hypothetical protein
MLARMHLPVASYLLLFYSTLMLSVFLILFQYVPSHWHLPTCFHVRFWQLAENYVGVFFVYIYCQVFQLFFISSKLHLMQNCVQVTQVKSQVYSLFRNQTKQRPYDVGDPIMPDGFPRMVVSKISLMTTECYTTGTFLLLRIHKH